MDLAKRITIGITTKDRWGVLSQTVNRLVELGLGDVPVVVVDDGSAEGKADHVCKPLTNCTVVRDSTSKGLVEQRNRIAAMAGADYLISLDDDSCFDGPHNLDKAVQYMDANRDVAVLAFWIVWTHPRPGRRRTGHCIKPLLSIPVRQYIGCGHMLRVQTFRELGGYRAYFRHMGEEQDFSLRVYGEGYRVVLFPDVTVIHTETQTARSWERISFFGARNILLCWLLNLPFPLCLWWCARSVRGLILDIFAGRRRFRATLHGILESGRFFWSHRMDRRPLSSVSLRMYFSIDEPRFE